MLFPDQNIQVWNNAAFDDASAAGDPSSKPLPWLPLQPISLNRSPQTIPGKENLSPVKQPSATSRPFPVTPFPRKQSKVQFSLPDDGSIDAEIEAIEKEMERLTARLERLRAEKSKVTYADAARRGRVVPARFLDSKQNSGKKPPEVTPSSVRRRGRSLGPSEIRGILQSTTPLDSASKRKPKSIAAESPAITRSVDSRRRGASLGPAEIYSATRNRQSVGTNKLKSIKEGSQKSNTKSGKTLQPKSLFKEEEKKPEAVAMKTPSKGAKSRIVPSRYGLVHSRPTSQGPESKRRKWSLPEKEDEKVPEIAKRSCVSLPEGVGGGGVEEMSPGLEDKLEKNLPRVRTSIEIPESPRDSGPAKRVAELIGRRTHFGEVMAGQQKDGFCQNLNFEEEGDEEAVEKE